MAIETAHHGVVSSGSARKRALLGVGLGLAFALVALLAAVVAWSGVTLASDSTALARVSVQPLGGTIQHVQAFGPDGARVPLAVSGGRLTPPKGLTPGGRGSVDVVVRRPGWLGRGLGR